MQLPQDAGKLQTNFKNAFNSIERSQILNPAVTLMPSLASFAIYCYSQHSHLYYSNKSVTSQSVVHQGDFLGPLLFSPTLSPIIEEIESKISNLTQYLTIVPWRWYYCWYRDDGIIAGTEPEQNEALDILTVSRKTCGLELRRDKCEVWSKAALNTTDNRIKRNGRERLEIMGAAAWSPRFVASSIQKRDQKIEKILENLEYIKDPQVLLAFYVVAWEHQKWCIHCAAIHHFRKLQIFLKNLTRLKDNLWENTGNSLVQWIMASSMFAYQKDWNWNPTSVWSDKNSLYRFDIAVCYISRADNWPKSDSRSHFYQNDWWNKWFVNISAYSKQNTGSPRRSCSQ